MRIAYLGPLLVQVSGEDGRPVAVEVPGQRLRRLLLRLALDAGAPVRTGELVRAVWPDGEPADPSGALQALVSRLRRAVGAAAVQQSDAGYRLLLSRDDVDAGRLTTAVEAGERAAAGADHAVAAELFGQGLALLRGEVLTDLDDAAAAVERSRVEVLADRARTGAAQALLALGRPAEALGAVAAAAEADPLREDLARWRMAALAALGRSAEALVVFERTRRALAEALGADPSPALARQHLAVLREEVAAAPAAPSPSSSPPSETVEPERRPVGLPATTSSFVGREEEVERLLALLGRARLVTVLGPGGTGKTRLSVETAHRVVAAPAAPQVQLVELAPLTDPADVDAAVADALGAREARLDRRTELPGRGEPRAALVEHLARRDVLVVLDNCEHVVAASADLVAELLARCPGLQVLATSREPLGVDGEHVVPLAPLPVPGPGASPDEVAASPAVQLLLERAAAAGADLAEADLPALAEVARRLDGAPLALELAASRLRTTAPAEVVRRLDDRFRLLTGGRRTAAARHRSLRAVVEWSWDLLDDGARQLAEACAVFAAGATPAALAAVLGADEADVADGLAELADRSIVVPVPTPLGTRYRMLETLREYARDRLAERGQLDAVRDRHAAASLRTAQELDARLRGPGQARALAEVDAEREDLVAALGHLAARGDAEGSTQLAGALVWSAALREEVEVFRWCATALAVPGAERTAMAPLLRALGAVRQVVAPPEGHDGGPDGGPDGVAHEGRLALERRPEVLLRAAAALAGAEDVHPVVAPLRVLVLWLGQDAEGAAAAVERGLASADPWVRACVLQVRSHFAENSGDLDVVRAGAEEALQRWQEVGDAWGTATALQVRGQVRAVDGDLAGAVEDLEDSRRSLRQLSPRADVRLTTLRLIALRSALGDHAGARRELEDLRGRSTPSALAGRADGSPDRSPDGSADGSADGRTALAMELLAASAALEVEDAAGDVAAREAALAETERHLAALDAGGAGTASFQQGTALARALVAAVLTRTAGAVGPRAAEHLRRAVADAVDSHDGPVLASVARSAAECAASCPGPAAVELAARLLGASDRLRGARDLGDARGLRLREQLGRSLGERSDELVALTVRGSREQAQDLLAGAADALEALPGQVRRR